VDIWSLVSIVMAGKRPIPDDDEAVPRAHPPCKLSRTNVMTPLPPIGVIFHWGIYSVPGYVKKSRIEGNGSEWYMKRLTETSTFRPVSGSKETKDFHNQNYPNSDYDDFSTSFSCDQWNVDEWMQLCKQCGATYVILTARHHDGYCLWPTETTSRNSVVSGPQRDLIGAFKEAAVRHGLKFGLYYSWMEFNCPITIKYVDSVITPQIMELRRYSPDIWWFDGHWEIKTKYASSRVLELCSLLTSDGAKVNDRITKEVLDENDLGPSSFRVYKDRYVPRAAISIPWQSVQTIGNSWGINKFTNEYKTGSDLFSIYSAVRKMGGSFLLNLGPDEHGQLDPDEVASLQQFGHLLTP
jgi:alpha-L-fucosidase